MGKLNRFLETVLCIASFYIIVVDGYPSLNENSNFNYYTDDILQDESRERIGSIHEPKNTITVLSNASNLSIVRKQLVNFQRSQMKKIHRHALRSNFRSKNYRKRVNSCIPYPFGYIPCTTKTVKKYPKVIINHDKHVFEPYEFENMEIPVEVCSNPDTECNVDKTHLMFENAKSFCKQVYTSHNIITTHGETTTTTFQIEFGCRCAVHVNGKEKYSYCPRNKYHL